MSVISTLIEPHRVTRVFFDFRAVVPSSADLRRIEQTIECSIALPQVNDAQAALPSGGGAVIAKDYRSDA